MPENEFLIIATFLTQTSSKERQDETLETVVAPKSQYLTKSTDLSNNRRNGSTIFVENWITKHAFPCVQ